MINIIRILQKKRSFILKTQGTSMLPLLHPNDFIFFNKTNFSKVRLNDIILVNKGNHHLTHRVIYKSDNYLITKGDNNLLSDGKLYPKNIIAKVVKLKRQGKIFDLENLYLVQSTLYFQEIIKIKKMFDQAKVSFVFLKGLPLHLYYVRKHPRRIYADCDILIDHNNYDKVQDNLITLGYKFLDTTYSPLHKILKNKQTEVTFIKKLNNNFISIDIHFEPVFLMNQLGSLNMLYPDRYLKNLTTLFLQEKKYITVLGESFPILSNSNLIIYLALHFFHHNFKETYRLHFLDTVIRFRAEEIEIDSLTSVINKYQIQNFVYPVYWFLQKYFKTPKTDMILKRLNIKSKELEYIKGNILHINIFNDESKVQAGINRFKNIFFLSPNTFMKKLTFIFNLQIIYSVLWVGFTKSYGLIIVFFRRSFSKSR